MSVTYANSVVFLVRTLYDSYMCHMMIDCSVAIVYECYNTMTKRFKNMKGFLSEKGLEAPLCESSLV